MIPHLFHYINDDTLMFIKLIRAYRTEIHDMVCKHYTLPELSTIRSKLAKNYVSQ